MSCRKEGAGPQGAEATLMFSSLGVRRRFFITTADNRQVNPGVPGLTDVLRYSLAPGRFTSADLSALSALSRTVPTIQARQLTQRSD